MSDTTSGVGPGVGGAGVGGAWSRPARRTREAPPLSRDRVVREALALLDEEGLKAFSLRRLAARLGVGAASLYWHVTSKDELLDLVVDEAMGEVSAVAPSGDWQADVRVAADSVRQVLLRHPAVSRLLTVSPAIGPNSLTRIEALLEVLARAGFSGAHLFYAYSAVITYVSGEVAQEVAWVVGGQEAGASPEVLEAMREQASADFERLDAAHFPRMRSLVGFFLDHDQDAQFRFGLDAVIGGLALLLGPDEA